MLQMTISRTSLIMAEKNQNVRFIEIFRILHQSLFDLVGAITEKII